MTMSGNTTDKKLLLLAADQSNSCQLAEWATEAGYQVTRDSHLDTDQVVSAAADLLVIDLDLPHPDLLSAIAELVTRCNNCPIVVLTHEGIESMTVEALKLDVTDYIHKPLQKASVLFSLASSLERARLEKENRNYRKELEEANQALKSQLDEMTRDQQAGYMVQQKMLPPTPYNLLGYHFEHLVLPADYLSGDFVDYHQVSPNKLVFFLLDVTGHGSSSAFVTVLIKQFAIRSRKHFQKKRSENQVNTAAWMLNWINRSLLDMELDRHMTIFLGVIDSETDVLNYSYGGHFPQAILNTEEGVRFLEGRGLPVGIFPDAQYEDHFIELPERFCLSVFSDGVLEVMEDDCLASKERHLLDLARIEQDRVTHYYDSLRLDNLEQAADDISILTVSRNSYE